MNQQVWVYKPGCCFLFLASSLRQQTSHLSQTFGRAHYLLIHSFKCYIQQWQKLQKTNIFFPESTISNEVYAEFFATLNSIFAKIEGKN